MKIKFLCVVISSVLMVSCASIPKETVILSKTIGADLQILHNSHRNTIQLYYNRIKANINTFIDEVYAPFVIHHVLESELSKYQKGESSIYSIIENAAKIGGKEDAKEALNVMLEFQEAANKQINSKRDELLTPILSQEMEVLNAIDQSYQNIIYANACLTAYIESARKIKESQSEALSIAGFKGLDTSITNRLTELSGLVDVVLEKGENIDVKSDKAQEQIEDIVNRIKELIKK